LNQTQEKLSLLTENPIELTQISVDQLDNLNQSDFKEQLNNLKNQIESQIFEYKKDFDFEIQKMKLDLQ
jgi:hypothetical protein